MAIITKPTPSEKQHSLTELAQVVASSAAIVDKELNEKDLPPLNDEQFPTSFPLLSQNGCRARLDLLSAALNIIRLASGPVEGLVNLTSQGFELGTIAALIRLRILEYIPLEGNASFAELSKRTGVEEQLLTRLIRYSISAGFLCEPTAGTVRHNAASSALLRDPGARDCILWNINVGTPASIKLFEALQLDPTGKDASKTGLSVAMAEPGRPLGSLWDYHAAHPDVERQFHNSMAATQSISIYACEHVVRGFDWNQVQTIVDVGGSKGHISMSIHDKYPHIKATVQDVGEVISTSRSELPPKYVDAIRFEEHDFLLPQSTVADCYILRFILHNWSDTDAKYIIRNLSPALKPGARVLVIEHVLPTDKRGALYMERILRNMDVSMFGLLAGRERTEDDLRRLLTEADPRLQLRSAVRPDGSAMSVLEFLVTE